MGHAFAMKDLAESPALPRRSHALKAVELLTEIQTGQRPADQILDAHFRAHREMGKRDRAAVSGLVYGVLHDVMRLQALAGAAPAAWIARHLADLGHVAEAVTVLDLPAPSDDAPVADHARVNLPADWHARLIAQLGEAQTTALAAALNQEAPVDLRVNLLKSQRADVWVRLAAEGVASSNTPYSPWGLRLTKRLSHTASVFDAGEVEPQDEGSQLLALLVNAAAGELVVDYCAGAGGKTLAMAAMMANQGRLVACDVAASRLAKIGPRAASAGVGIIEIENLSRENRLGELRTRADAVLVDAPCSGTGTLRRAPDLRLKAVDSAALAALQAQILADAAKLVKHGGRLIYATCSLFAEENETVVEAFLNAHPNFARDASAPERLPLAAADGSLRLWPHVHGTDGFYACAMLRVG